MPTQFERTTVSFTSRQMTEMKKLIELGEFPDLTEAVRAAVNMFLDLRTLPSVYEWYKSHPECSFEDDYKVYAKHRKIPAGGDDGT